MAYSTRLMRRTAAAVLLVGGVAFAAETPGPKSGDVAPPIELKTLQGQMVSLAALTKQSPVVVLFLRGFPGYQCPLCTKQVGQYVASAEQFKAAGARVLMVYPGPADGLMQHAEEFVHGRAMPDGFDMVIDPDYAAVNAWHLRWDAPKETAYPSTYVVDTVGKIVFAKSSTTHGDRASVKEVLPAIPKSKP